MVANHMQTDETTGPKNLGETRPSDTPLDALLWVTVTSMSVSGVLPSWHFEREPRWRGKDYRGSRGLGSWRRDIQHTESAGRVLRPAVSSALRKNKFDISVTQSLTPTDFTHKDPLIMHKLLSVSEQLYNAWLLGCGLVVSVLLTVENITGCWGLCRVCVGTGKEGSGSAEPPQCCGSNSTKHNKIPCFLYLIRHVKALNSREVSRTRGTCNYLWN